MERLPARGQLVMKQPRTSLNKQIHIKHNTRIIFIIENDSRRNIVMFFFLVILETKKNIKVMVNNNILSVDRIANIQSIYIQPNHRFL